MADPAGKINLPVIRLFTDGYPVSGFSEISDLFLPGNPVIWSSRDRPPGQEAKNDEAQAVPDLAVNQMVVTGLNGGHP